jgi:class 3 adenylate cyclase
VREVPDVRYARSGDIDIAYTVTGSGPIDIVYVPGFISHLELLQDVRIYTALHRSLASFSRLVTFDKRGTGLSDRSLGFGSAADRMDDIRAVMDSAGIESAALFGVSEGGPLSILFAATYPERITKLALYGTYARMLRAPDYPIGTRPERYDDAFAFMRDYWGTGHVLRVFVQNVPDEALPTLARYERNSCTPHMVEEIMRKNVEMDVRAALPAINVPTLVLHSSGDPAVPVRHARYMADHIPNARYVEIQANVHADWNMSEVWPDLREFLLGSTPPPDPNIDRVLATVLFTDIVASTERSVAIGDHRWRDVLDQHDRLAQVQVDRFAGRIVKTTGDGLLATFDGPARAIHCAESLRKSVGSLGLGIRAGVHTGEIERRGEDVSGLGVVIARRVCDLALDGELLASRTVKDLVTGSGIAFADRGAHALKGVPDDWQLFAVET